MTDLCAIQADYVNWRPVNGRKVLQLVFEVPLESTHDVLTKLGTPTPGESKWVAIALLDLKRKPGIIDQRFPSGITPQDTPFMQKVQVEGGSPKKWNDYARSQQAYILCRDPDFCRYFGADGGSETATSAKLRTHFKIGSRGDLDKPENHDRWDEFVALFHLHRDRLK